MKLLVIGGGMAGMTSAIISARNGIDVTLCERNNRLGKKLAMTGNGKCNLGNENINKDCYNKCSIVSDVIRRVPLGVYRHFLRSLGIITYTDDCGRMYPLCDSASGVVDCFRTELDNLGVNVMCGVVVSDVTRTDNGFEVTIDGTKHNFDQVIVACGSGSQAQAVFPMDGIIPCKYFTHLSPSLTPVKVENMDKVLNGIRVKCGAKLICDGETVCEEDGEVLFKDYGLSGICIFNLSSYVSREIVLGNKHTYNVVLDLLPTLDEQKLCAELNNRIAKDIPTDKLLYGLLHNKVAECVIKRSGRNAERIAHVIKNFSYKLDKLLDYSMSQVTCGGIDERHLDNFTLPNGIKVCGELLNVDGKCGGYNLFFACASAICVCDTLCNI